MTQTVVLYPNKLVPPKTPSFLLTIDVWKEFRLTLKAGTNLDISDDVIEKLKASNDYKINGPDGYGAIQILSAEAKKTTIKPDNAVDSLSEDDAITAVTTLTDIDQLKAIAISSAKLERGTVADAANRRISEIQAGKTASKK